MKKVFDFNVGILPFNVIGRPREIGWPCEMIRLTLPRGTREMSEKFNALELCVLKLLACSRYEPQDLVDETCLPKDLIEIILLRLFDCGKIDEHYNVKQETLAAIEKNDAQSNADPADYETCVVFRECISGKILPMLKEGNLRTEEINDDGNILKNNGENKYREIRLWGLPLQRTHSKPPSVAELISAMRKMSRRNGAAWNDLNIPDGQNIIITGTPEPCVLRVRMVLQMRGDWRILNPFGNGYSPELELSYLRYLNENSEEGTHLAGWQRANLDKTHFRLDNKQPTAPYDTDENRKRYPELIATLKRSQLDVHAVLEWTIFYYIRQYDLKNLIQQIQIAPPESIAEQLQSIIQELNLQPAHGIVNVPLEGKLRSFQDEGMAEMSVVLPIALLLIREESNYPLRHFISEHGDFLERIADLKKRHDENRHGKSIWSTIYGDDDYCFMKAVIGGLLPDIHFSCLPDKSHQNTENNFDKRLNALLVSQEFFGVANFDRMDDNIREALLQAEMLRQDYSHSAGDAKNEKFDVIDGINHLYAALEATFRPYLVGKRPESSEMSFVMEKAKRAGWKEFPVSLSTVRPEMITRALDGYDPTLGASVIAWILFSEDDFLQNVAEKAPTFLVDIDNLLSLDKHGQQSCYLRSDDYSKLVDNVHKLIVAITEV